MMTTREWIAGRRASVWHQRRQLAETEQALADPVKARSIRAFADRVQTRGEPGAHVAGVRVEGRTVTLTTTGGTLTRR